MSKPLPNQVNVYTAAEVTRSASGTDEERWGISSCLSTTKAGDRSVIYQSGSDAGIVSLFDFATDAAAHPDLKFVAWGKEILLDTPTPRAELLADPKLASVFRSIQGRRALPADAAAALEEMLGGLPDFSGPEGPAPADFETWRWSPAGKGHTWGNEEAMQQAIAEQEPAWTRLGFDGAPQREVHPPGSRDEIDLYGPGMIGECKLLAEARDLAQLDRYLEPLNRDAAHLSPAGRWHGLLIAAHGYSRELATAIAERPDVQLLVCLRGPHDEATFVEVTDPDQAPPDLEAQPSHMLADVLTIIRMAGGEAEELARLAGASQGDIDAAIDDGEPEIPEGVDEDAFYEGLSPEQQAGTTLARLLSAHRQVFYACADTLELTEDQIDAILNDRSVP